MENFYYLDKPNIKPKPQDTNHIRPTAIWLSGWLLDMWTYTFQYYSQINTPPNIKSGQGKT